MQQADSTGAVMRVVAVDDLVELLDYLLLVLPNFRALALIVLLGLLR